ncbi:transcriptional regulator [Parcubacteria bacterium DG_74_3]|nr:MAG: transcriptional regulator [Parcubacteria bacterium DG_74_3]
MSGHSHWHRIKHKKGLADAKKSKVFSKMAQLISVAVREGGEDPDANPELKLAIEKAKIVNLPRENIERAIKRGIGELEAGQFQGFLFEAYGPGKIAIIIEGLTDNKNRTLGEIKKTLSEHNGKLVREGSVRWLFERKGVISIIPEAQPPNLKNREELALKVIEAGAEDLYWHEDLLDVYTKIQGLERVRENLERQGIQIESVSLDWVAKEQVLVSEKEREAAEELFEALDENEAVQEIYSNLKD